MWRQCEFCAGMCGDVNLYGGRVNLCRQSELCGKGGVNCVNCAENKNMWE
jgi:hypothetical protein